MKSAIASLAAAVLAGAGLAGCSTSSASRASVAPGYAQTESAPPPPAPVYSPPMEMNAAPMAEPEPSPMKAPAAAPRSVARSRSDDNPGAARQETPPPPQQQQPQQPKPEAPQRQQRMVHYNGYAKLKVTSPDATIDEAVKITEAAKGYVEARNAGVVTLRVPVAAVLHVFGKLLELGDVVARSLSAQDVTDAFVAAELRLKILRSARDRLLELLTTTTNEQQKISLLQEIQRLSEQITSLEVQVKTLAQLAVFSRITLEAIPKQPHTTSPVDELASFRWIHELTPFGRAVANRGDELELEAPKDMVVLDDDDHWVAESADGAVLWTSKRENEPRGDTAFWLGALRERMAQDYPGIEEVTIGQYSFLRITDTGERHYRYLVGVMAHDDELNLVEVYFPNAEAEERHSAAVRAAVERGET